MLPAISTPLRFTGLLSILAPLGLTLPAVVPDAFAGTCTQEQSTAGQHLVDVSGEMRMENGQAQWTRVFVFTNAEGALTGLRIDDDCYNEAALRAGILIRIDGVDDDYKALRLSAATVNAATGGTLTLRYLQNGISNHYRNFNMNLRRVDGQWKLFTRQNALQPIRSLWMRENTFLGELVGIDGIDPRLSTADPKVILPSTDTDAGVPYAGIPDAGIPNPTEPRAVSTFEVKPASEIATGGDADAPDAGVPDTDVVPASTASDPQSELPPNHAG